MCGEFIFLSLESTHQGLQPQNKNNIKLQALIEIRMSIFLFWTLHIFQGPDRTFDQCSSIALHLLAFDA